MVSELSYCCLAYLASKLVITFFYCFSKAMVQTKIFCKWCIYISYGLWNCLAGLLLRLDVCVIVVCMLLYK